MTNNASTSTAPNGTALDVQISNYSTAAMTNGEGSEGNDDRAVFFFDIDNCLYPASKRIHNLMAVLIDRYFQTHLSLTAEDAVHLHNKYYTQYGLAIEGLVRHHKVDPLEYNEQVDDALPLDTILSPDPELRAFLQSFDRTKVKLWLFTNAYVTHGARVVRLLGVEDCFEGMTYCDYGEGSRSGIGGRDGRRMVCKPHAEAFDKAERDAGAGGKRILFVDDSRLNCAAAQKRGWETVHKIEPESPEPNVNKRASRYLVRRLGEIRGLFPELFKEGQGEVENTQEAQ